jgi:hypothetical protein
VRREGLEDRLGESLGRHGIISVGEGDWVRKGEGLEENNRSGEAKAATGSS